jgi:hypothetical protein
VFRGIAEKAVTSRMHFKHARRGGWCHVGFGQRVKRYRVEEISAGRWTGYRRTLKLHRTKAGVMMFSRSRGDFFDADDATTHSGQRFTRPKGIDGPGRIHL